MHQLPEDQPPKPTKISLLTRDQEELLRDLAHSILDALVEDSQQDHEPFESYAYQLRVRLQKDNQIFFARLIHGYQVLLEQLHSTPSSE